MARTSAQLGVNLYAEVAQMRAATRELQSSVNEMGASMDRLAGAADAPARGFAEAERTAQMLGRGFLAAGGAILSGFAMATKAAMDWELAFADVIKTVDASDEQLVKLDGDLRQLARTIPVAHDEIARIASIAGQLGLQANEIAKFTEVTANMAVATTLSADEAAFALARLSNIMNLDVTANVEDMADTFVHLGNNMAATETEIVAMATNFASAGAVAGLTTEEVLAMSASLSSVGIHAEAGGTALGRFALEMDGAVRDGSDKLETFARVADVTADQFAEAYRTRPTEAMLMFLEGLNNVVETGGSVTDVLRDLSLNEIRVRRALLSMAGNTELVADALGFANEGWHNSTALLDEVTVRYDTAHMSIETAKNTIRDIAIEIGNGFVPVVTDAAQLVQDYGRAFGRWNEEGAPLVTTMGGIAAGILGVTGAFLLGIQPLNAFRGSMTNLVQNGTTPLQRGLGSVGTLLTGKLFPALIAGTALIGAWTHHKAMQVAREEEWIAVLREGNGEINEHNREMALGILVSEGWVDSFKGAGGSTSELVEAVDGGTESFQEFNKQIVDLGWETRQLRDPISGTMQLLGMNIKLTDDYADSLREAGFAIDESNEITAEQAEHIVRLVSQASKQERALEGATNQQENYNEVMEEGEGPTKTLTQALEEHNDELERAQQVAEEAMDAVIGLRIANGDMHLAQRELLDTIKDNGQVWDETTEKGLDNWRMLEGWASSVTSRADAVREATGDDEAANEVIQEGIDWLSEHREQLGLNSEEYDELTDALESFTSGQMGVNEHVAVATEAIQLFERATGEAADSLSMTADEMGEVASEASDLRSEIEAGNDPTGELSTKYDELAESLSDVFIEMGYTRDTADELASSLIMGEDIMLTEKQMRELGNTAGTTGKRYETLEEALGAAAGSLGQNREEMELTGEGMDSLIESAHDLNGQFERNEITAERYSNGMDFLKRQFMANAEEAGINRLVAEELWETHREGEVAVADLRDIMKELENQFGWNIEEVDDFDRALSDAGVQADLTNDQMGSLMDQTYDLLVSNEELNKEYREGTKDSEELRKEQGRLEDQFVDLAEDMGIAEGQARALWKEIRDGDGLAVTAKVKVEGEYEWGGGFDNTDQSWGGPMRAHKDGGAIYGPGDGTSDDIPSWLSNGEHVLTAREVNILGGQDSVYRLRQSIRSGGLKNVYETPQNDRHMSQTVGSYNELQSLDGAHFSRGGAVGRRRPGRNRGGASRARKYSTKTPGYKSPDRAERADTKIWRDFESRYAFDRTGRDMARASVGAIESIDTALDETIKHFEKQHRSFDAMMGGAGPLPPIANIGGAIGQALRFARSMHGTPYRWGGGTPAGYDCCITGNSLVYGPDGPRRIDEIRPGDLVWSYEDGKKTERKVVVAWQSETQHTFKIRTRNRSITASDNHPFKRLIKTETRKENYDDVEWSGVIDGRGDGSCTVGECERKSHSRGLCQTHYSRWRTNGDPRVHFTTGHSYDVEWARADHLKTGDLLIEPKDMSDINVDSNPTLPDGTPVTEELAWLIGVLLGDGSVSSSGFAVAVYGEIADRVSKVVKNTWGKDTKTGTTQKWNSTFLHSKAVGVCLQQFGIESGAHLKRIPDGVWTWSESLKRSFLDGYRDADGHTPKDQKRHGERTYSSVSENLIAETRAMHMMLGDSVSNISTSRRSQMTGDDLPEINGVRVKKARDMHTFAVWPGTRSGFAALVRNHHGVGEWVEQNDFTVNKILAIDSAGVQETYDIEVEGSHNFVAEGIVISNSGYMAAIQKILMGQRPYGRLWSTHAFTGSGPAGWQRNLRSPFMVGVTHAGVGHMSGTLAGYNIESRGSAGHVFGPRARGWNNPLYSSHWGFAPLAGSRAFRQGSGGSRSQSSGRASGSSASLQHGSTHPATGSASARVLDEGGIWGHGQMGINLTKPERVLSPRQTLAFDRLVDILDREGINANTTINQYGINGFSDVQEINRAQAARDRARGVGRNT